MWHIGSINPLLCPWPLFASYRSVITTERTVLSSNWVLNSVVCSHRTSMTRTVGSSVINSCSHVLTSAAVLDTQWHRIQSTSITSWSSSYCYGLFLVCPVFNYSFESTHCSGGVTMVLYPCRSFTTSQKQRLKDRLECSNGQERSLQPRVLLLSRAIRSEMQRRWGWTFFEPFWVSSSQHCDWSETKVWNIWVLFMTFRLEFLTVQSWKYEQNYLTFQEARWHIVLNLWLGCHNFQYP